jgi:hypothetical protein
MHMRLIRTATELEREGVSLFLLKKYPAGIAVGTYSDVIENTVTVIDESARDGLVILAYCRDEPVLISAEIIERPAYQYERCLVGGKYPIKLAAYAHHGPMRFLQGWEKYRDACGAMPRQHLG